jgi:hypothetical protein
MIDHREHAARRASRRDAPPRRAIVPAFFCAASVALALFCTAPAVRAASGPVARLASHVAFGVSDNSPAIFRDPRFRWLGPRIARLVVAWDVVQRTRELGWDAAWLRAARAAGARPLVVFTADPRHWRLPSVREYAAATGSFMSLFGWVRDYTAWNEENHPREPTARNPRRAAEYFNVLSARCPGCSVTAADVLDISNMASWLRGFLRYAHRPRLWGLHNYIDLWQGRYDRTSLLLRIVQGQVWFTETGGVVWRWERPYGSRRATFVVHPEQQAALVAARLARLAAISPRIARIYYYQWRVPRTLRWARSHGRISWDSGLMRPDCSARPAFAVIARMLGHDPARVPRARRDRAGDCV